MTEGERAAWLKTLKEGDQVCYTIKGSFGGRNDVRVVFVKKVTPTGMVRVSDDTLFNTRGKSDFGKRWVFLEPYTKNIKDYAAREKLINSANHSAFVLDSNRVDLSKVASELLEELVSLETRISLSLKKKEE